MAEERLEKLKDKLTQLESPETTGSNKDRRKLAVALELCEVQASMDLRRGVVQYADLAIDIDAECIAAHVFKVEALKGMCGKPNHKSVSKASKACEKALKACGRVVSLEGLGEMRAKLEAIKADLAVLSADAPPPPPKAKKAPKPVVATTAVPAPPQRVTQRPPSSAAPEDVVKSDAAPTTDAVRLAGGGPMSKSAWNTKDTWEEREVTSWAVERFSEMLKETSMPIRDGLALQFYDMKQVVGNAQVVIFQRKIRYLFDFERSDLYWVATNGEGGDGTEVKFKGAATLLDCANGASTNDMELSTSFNPREDEHKEVKDFLRKKDGALAGIALVVARFEQEFTEISGEGTLIARSFPRSPKLAAPEGQPDDPALLKAKQDAAKRQAMADDLKANNPKLKVVM